MKNRILPRANLHSKQQPVRRLRLSFDERQLIKGPRRRVGRRSYAKLRQLGLLVK